MKLIKYAILASCLIFSGSALAQQALKDNPANLNIDEVMDLKTHKPTVNINIPKFLLKNALSEFDGGKGDPLAKHGIDLDELVGGIKLIRLVVYEGIKDEKVRADVHRGAKALMAKLEQEWTPIVAVDEENEKVMICALGDESGEDMAGLAKVIIARDEVVIGNIVGSVPLGKIAKIGMLMGEDMLPPEILQQLEALGGAFNNTGQGKDSQQDE